ncbi:hypothetical protein [Aliarcobacter butzleri]|uniref:hypothetical protein n=1 Tax=Aliarcobacter butzleri TaxID=28197 RepID=UPI001867D871|nr:hypothetical protein [Aliarcobacter butzleri]
MPRIFNIMIKNYFTDENIDKLERVINFIKPKFYNKLTWLIVGVGLATISKPLWLEIVNTLFNKNFQINITDANDTIIGFLLVITALMYNLTTVYFDKFLISKQETLKQEKWLLKDKLLFEKFLEELPSNGSIEFLKIHSFQDGFYLEYLRQILNFEQNWNDAEHEFINEKLEKLRKELLENIKKFVYVNANGSYSLGDGYFTTTPDAYRLDDWNMPQHVIDKMKEMDDLADKVVESHQTFIRVANKVLN